MQVIITTKNLELTEELKDFIDEKMGKIERFIRILQEDALSIAKGKTLSEIFIEIRKETNRHKKGEVFKTEAILSLPGKKLVASITAKDVKRSVVEVKREIEREIAKYKTRTIDIPRKKISKSKQKNKI